jgi:hypothetical protein
MDDEEQAGQSWGTRGFSLIFVGGTDLECDGIGIQCTKSLRNRMLPVIIVITCHDERG